LQLTALALPVLASSNLTGITVSIERDAEAITDAWEELANRLDALPFVRPGWMLAWSRAFAPGRLAVLAARQETELVGALPFVRRPLAGSSPTNWHTPVFGYLAANHAVSQALAERFISVARVRADLAFLDRDDPNLQMLLDAAAAGRRRVILRTIMRSPYVQLVGTDWETYRSSLKRRMTKDIERRKRRLAELGDVRLEVLDGSHEIAAALREGLLLEGSGWKERRGTAILSEPATRRFYEDVARWASERGWLELAFLRLGDKAIAFDLCIRVGGAIHVLKGGFDPTYRRLGPGSVLTYESLRRAFGHGLSSYELLGDDDEYKRVWTTSTRERIRLQAFANSLPGRVSHLAWSRGRNAALRTWARRWTYD
jgi:CelD/BcsL family acetyltransferase involved in cellulose biosynthesis